MTLVLPRSSFDDPPATATLIKRGTSAYPNDSTQYRFKVTPQGGLNFYFHPKIYHPKDPYQTIDYQRKDRGLDVRILKSGRIDIVLDDDPIQKMGWYFEDRDDVIYFKQTPNGKYRNLNFQNLLGAGKYGTVSFDVDYLGDVDQTKDEFNVIVCLPQLMSDGVTNDPEALVLIVDPGIKNPGDDP